MTQFTPHPASPPSPARGEGNRAETSQSGLPSPLAGEGARRADEGGNANRAIESTPRLKNFAKTLRRQQTDAEQRMWRLLRDRRFDGVKFRRQVPIGPYVADFVCFDAKVIVELDGSQHAESTRDAVRDKWLTDDGYRVVRVWNNDVLFRQQTVLETIWHEVPCKTDPSSGAACHLLPQGEKGVPTEGVGE